MGDFDEYSRERLLQALLVATGGRDYNVVDGIEVVLTLIETEDWQETFRRSVSGTPSNQASLVSLADQHPIVDRMHFQDQAEVRVYEAFTEKQRSLPNMRRSRSSPTAQSGSPIRLGRPIL